MSRLRISVATLVSNAKVGIKEIWSVDAIGLKKNEDKVFVDLRDIRE